MNNGIELIALLYMHEHLFLSLVSIYYCSTAGPLVHAYNFRLKILMFVKKRKRNTLIVGFCGHKGREQRITKLPVVLRLIL